MKNYKLITKSTLIAGLLFGKVLFANTEIIEPSSIDQIKSIIQDDINLKKRVSSTSIEEAIFSIDRMNTLIREAIVEQGLVNDGSLSVSDIREINKYLSENYLDEWNNLKGNKEDYIGYSKVLVRRGSRTIALNRNAVHLWGKIYDLGFPKFDKNRLSTYNGNKNTSFSQVANWLSQIMDKEIKSGSLNNEYFEEIKGTTETSLDDLIGLILNDKGLQRRVSMSDLREGLRTSNEMNLLIKEAIINEGLANDNKLTTADIRQINLYLTRNHLELWKELHGDDEKGEETGYHLIQNDGATSRMFADNVVNSIADGIFHLGFITNRKNRLENEDGNANKRFEKVAWWLDTILKDDLNAGTLKNRDFSEIKGTTGTRFDEIIPVIYQDEGLLLNVSMEDIREGAKCSNEMNHLIIEAIKETNVVDDGHFSIDDIKKINSYLVENHAQAWKELHGDDETEEETGFHKIQNDGARTIVDNRNLFNNLADSIYHLGFKTEYRKNLANEDGNKNASFRTVAYWMNKYLKEDIQNGVFK